MTTQTMFDQGLRCRGKDFCHLCKDTNCVERTKDYNANYVKPNKLCIITNAKFCWVLKVDGQEIPFNTAVSADYFEEHYKSLGYEVRREKED